MSIPIVAGIGTGACFRPLSLRARPDWVPYLAERTGLGWPVPRAQNVRIEWKSYNYDTTLSARVVYPTSGPTFTAYARATRIDRWLPSERLGLEGQLGHEALLAVQAQVQAHNAVVQPIDNGPEPLVYLAETQYRVMAALAEFTGTGQFDPQRKHELLAAIAANSYAGDEAVEYFRSFNPEE